MRVREKPPLRLDIAIRTPALVDTDERFGHWSDTEADPSNVPSGLRFSSTMPGGFESLDATLPRRSQFEYEDLERFSTVTVHGPGGDIAWEGRLERVPRVSGDSFSVAPGCVGWQAHLEDDRSAVMVYVDADIGQWVDAPVLERLRVANANVPWAVDYTVSTDQGLAFTGNTGKAIPSGSRVAVHYIAPSGVKVAKVMYRGQKQNTTNVATVFRSTDGSDWTTVDTITPTWDDTLRTGSLATERQRVQLIAQASATHTPAAGAPFGWQVTKLAVYGATGTLTTRANGSEPDGFYPSDIVGHAVDTWCPLLSWSFDTIEQDTSFIIPHIAFREPTTAAEIIRQATRYGLQDWAVWENKLFYWHERGARGRSWRARVGPSGLEETGRDTARLFNGVIVEYRDVDGTTKTVGPTGSGADTESTNVEDADPQNPANQLGINRWEKLSMGTSTAAGATEVGRRFLEETAALDSSGRARLVGHCLDDKGVLHPAWRVRAGDTIVFTDAADTSERRIVKSSYEHSDRSVSIDLDAPPQAMDALLARLDVVLTPLGVS